MNRELKLGSDTISDDSDCYVIAEIGHNHQGRLELAKEMCRTAKDCGANAVKLQKRDNISLFTQSLYKSDYTNENSYSDTYGAHREALEFGTAEYSELKQYAEEIGLTIFATAFDLASADFLAKLDMPVYKMASGDLKNTPLLQYVASIGKPIIISTGGGTLEDVQRAYDCVVSINSQVCIMQCTASYPVNPADMNLSVITTYRECFPDVVIGLSDHQNGIGMAMIAYTLGARVIEKHFTMDRTLKGTDHAFSLEPVGLRKLIRDLRRGREAMGDGVKKPLPCEQKPLYKMGKKLVAAHDLPAGHLLTKEDIAIKSPNNGLPPFELNRVLGKSLRNSLVTDENITLEDLSDGPLT